MSIFTKPVTWFEGLRRLAARKLLPTTLGTEKLREISGDIKRWATFSAKIESVEALQQINDTVKEVIRGIEPKDEETFTYVAKDGTVEIRRKKPLQLSIPKAKEQIKRKFMDLGIKVDDAAKVGTVADPVSDARLQLIVTTQESLANNYGTFIAGQDADILDLWPCQELVRISPVAVERNWKERWQSVGGNFYDGRMIALKNSDIWDRLGSSELFPDALGNPYPPFAFNSGMGVEDISRSEAEELGVIAPGTPAPLPRDREIAKDVSASPDQFDEELKQALAKQSDIVLQDGVLTMR